MKYGIAMSVPQDFPSKIFCSSSDLGSHFTFGSLTQAIIISCHASPVADLMKIKQKKSKFSYSSEKIRHAKYSYPNLRQNPHLIHP